MVCFAHFDLEMCFAPQRRALFRHLNFQKCSDPGVFCRFWIGNVFRATTVCFFSTSQLPKVLRTWCVLYILTWKCVWRHDGVHFFDISIPNSAPTLRCLCILTWHVLRATTACNFSSLIWPDGSAPAALAILPFDLEKHSGSRLSYLFARLRLLSSDSFSCLIFSLLFFSLLTLTTSAFQSVHIVGNLTPKFPSAKQSSCGRFPSQPYSRGSVAGLATQKQS